MEVLLFDPLERALWLLVIVKDAIVGPFFIYRGHKTKVKNERLILYGFGLFILFTYFLGSIFLYLSRFFIEGRYVGHSYYFDFDENLFVENFLNIYYSIFAYLSSIGVFFFIFMFERAVKSTKYLLSLTYITLLVLSIIDFNSAIFKDIYATYAFSIILIWLSLKSSKKFQITSVFLIIGYNIAVIGTQFELMAFYFNVHPSLAPALILLGGLFIFLPFFVNLDTLFKEKSSIYWTMLIVINIIIIGWMISVALNIPFLLRILGMIYSPIFVMPIALSVKQLAKERSKKKFEIPKEIQVSKDEFEDIVKVFTKPRKITEEDVSISKEKQICIVCKNEILRNNYICPECKTFYCLKCSNALTDSENACWVCDTPFDELKPSKPLREEAISKEDIDVDIIDDSKTLKKQ